MTGSNAIDGNQQSAVSEKESRADIPRKKTGGLNSKTVIVPLIMILAVMHAAIIMLILSINTESGNLSTTMRDSGNYVSEATSLLAGSSLMSETSSNYIMMPVDGTGAVNFGPLVAYTAELQEESHRGSSIVANFSKYKVSPEVFDSLSEAADSADLMIEKQLHGIALVNAVYPLPSIPPLQGLVLPELTEEEKALSDEQKVLAARNLVLDSEYGNAKQTLSADVNKAVGLIQQSAGMQSAQISSKVAFLRVMLWVFTLGIILILLIALIILHRLIIFPLNKFVRVFADSGSLDENRGLKEVRLVASAYNGLKNRRDALDAILRSAATTDTLTNLPNRYAFEQYLAEFEQEGFSLAIIYFDVNRLKKTNDSLGYQAGDQLLKDTAECIRYCFGSAQDSRCFRLGGDEFAAVIRNISPEQVSQMIESFEQDQKDRGISISWGYDYTEEMSQTTIKNMIENADRNMYERKKLDHQKEEV